MPLEVYRLRRLVNGRGQTRPLVLPSYSCENPGRFSSLFISDLSASRYTYKSRRDSSAGRATDRGACSIHAPGIPAKRLQTSSFVLPLSVREANDANARVDGSLHVAITWSMPWAWASSEDASSQVSPSFLVPTPTSFPFLIVVEPWCAALLRKVLLHPAHPHRLWMTRTRWA